MSEPKRNVIIKLETKINLVIMNLETSRSPRILYIEFGNIIVNMETVFYFLRFTDFKVNSKVSL